MSVKDGNGNESHIWDMALKGAVRGSLVGMVLGAFVITLFFLFLFYALDVGGFLFLISLIPLVIGGVFFGTIYGAVIGAPVWIVIGVMVSFKPSGVQSD